MEEHKDKSAEIPITIAENNGDGREAQKKIESLDSNLSKENEHFKNQIETLSINVNTYLLYI